MKLSDLKKQAFSLAGVSSSAALKHEYPTVRIHDLRQKASWLTIVNFLETDAHQSPLSVEFMLEHPTVFSRSEFKQTAQQIVLEQGYDLTAMRKGTPGFGGLNLSRKKDCQILLERLYYFSQDILFREQFKSFEAYEVALTQRLERNDEAIAIATANADAIYLPETEQAQLDRQENIVFLETLLEQS